MSSWANYDSVLDQLQGYGLDVRSVEVGRLRRVRGPGDSAGKKNSWYVLHEIISRSGEPLLVGAYGSWREGVDDGGKPVSHAIELDKSLALSDEERLAIRDKIASDRKRAAAQRAAEANRAAQRATSAWRQCVETGHSDYLRRKGVGAHGVRYSPGGNLVVPMLDARGSIHGLQVIYSQKKHGRDKDFWPAGLAKRGHYHLVGLPVWVLLVAEGYATAASLHEATGLPVAVAFDAGNLTPVCNALRKRYPGVRLLVCGDDDYLTDGNPGVRAASVAAMAVDGAWFVPSFASRNEVEKLTDFNDLHQAEGLHMVRSQVEAKLRELGWRPRGEKAAAPERNQGGGGNFTFDANVLLEHYSLIYGTDTAFDDVRKMVIGLGPLRAAAKKEVVRAWLEMPTRRAVMADQVGFDPTGDAGLRCNLWDGWPTRPVAGRCEKLLELLEYLCSGDERPTELYHWVLRWLAYPIQHPGAKMQTALLMHGPEGTGKNTFFGCIKKIYGKYGIIFGQTELESQFNGCFSAKLFGIGNEVVTRMELYHQQGRLKNMVTETEWMINEKNLPTRQEANHCNFVFFSNRIDIARLDRDDRRYCVVWTPQAAIPEFYAEVTAEVANGGAEALHDYLLNLDLGDFTPHTKPPMTRAKRDLIRISMDYSDSFFEDWKTGALSVPFGPALAADVYSAFLAWCRSDGIAKPPPRKILIANLEKKSGCSYSVENHYRTLNCHAADITKSRFITPEPSKRPTADIVRWYTSAMWAFKNALNAPNEAAA